MERILVDAVHPEDVRVALVKNNRLEELDLENAGKKQIKGNIYLGKITRIETSLQAAFVEYGNGKQGFLPFSEVHYDYFQIPTADKEKLARAIENEQKINSEIEAAEEEKESNEEARPEDKKAAKDVEKQPVLSEEELEAKKKADELARAFAQDEGYAYKKDGRIIDNDEPEGDIQPSTFYKKYKINEVLKRNQILLVQVIKEERGNKGSALTTYISLAGRYSVYMPNATNSGGVSKRIDNFTERRRLRKILKNLEIKNGSVIVRTAGIGASDKDIENDYVYLAELWHKIRERTLESDAPALIYEESNIVKRAIRDMYKKSVKEIVVEGEKAFQYAKDFISGIDSDNKEKVLKYEGIKPLFAHYRIDKQLEELFNHSIKLPSGGSIVINPTEALVSIDVNSGKANRERGVEETAYKNNVEAAKEVARQLKLRDLAGLVVIDFIDMREVKHRKSVENTLKDALKEDRASTQVGRISIFGLLEMSRQRLHSSIVESNTVPCPHCRGTGLVRSNSSSAVMLLRNIQIKLNKGDIKEITVNTSYDLANYLLNRMRKNILEIEKKYDSTVIILGNDKYSGGDYGVDFIKKPRQHNKKEKSSALEANNENINPSKKEQGDKVVSIDKNDESKKPVKKKSAPKKEEVKKTPEEIAQEEAEKKKQDEKEQKEKNSIKSIWKKITR